MESDHFTFKRDGRTISSVRTCPVCDGSGLYTLEQPTCPTCDGKGLVWDRDYVETLREALRVERDDHAAAGRTGAVERIEDVLRVAEGAFRVG